MNGLGDALEEVKAVANAWKEIQIGLDYYVDDRTNDTAFEQMYTGVNAMASATYKTLFDTLSVTVAKRGTGNEGGVPNLEETHMQYYRIFDLIVTYSFVAVSLVFLAIFLQSI